MIAYLDTSAVIPLIIEEPTSKACQRLWDDADVVVSTRLTYVEAAAALAQACRLDRLTQTRHRKALSILDELWSEVDVVEIDQTLASRAAELAFICALRGYDAVQCASAEAINDDDTIAGSGDRKLLAAWRQLKMMTYDTRAAARLGH